VGAENFSVDALTGTGHRQGLLVQLHNVNTAKCQTAQSGARLVGSTGGCCQLVGSAGRVLCLPDGSGSPLVPAGSGLVLCAADDHAGFLGQIAPALLHPSRLLEEQVLVPLHRHRAQAVRRDLHGARQELCQGLHPAVLRGHEHRPGGRSLPPAQESPR